MQKYWRKMKSYCVNSGNSNRCFTQCRNTVLSPYGDNCVFQYPNVSPPISRQPLHLQPRMQCLSMQITSVILTTPQASLLDQYCRRYRTFKLLMLFCSISAISRRPRGQSSRFFFPLAALDNTFPTSPHSSRHDP